MTDTITSLIEKLEAGPIYLTHKEAYDLAIWFGSDTALGLAQLIRKAFVGGSLDAALALAERVLPGARVMVERFHDGKGWTMVQRAPESAKVMTDGSTPALALCAAILRAQSEAR